MQITSALRDRYTLASADSHYQPEGDHRIDVFAKGPAIVAEGCREIDHLRCRRASRKLVQNLVLVDREHDFAGTLGRARGCPRISQTVAQRVHERTNGIRGFIGLPDVQGVRREPDKRILYRVNDPGKRSRAVWGCRLPSTCSRSPDGASECRQEFLATG